MSDELLGGWSTYSCKITPQQLEVFETAMDGIIGVDYAAVAVATQDVAGTNYAFFCNGKVVAPDMPNYGAVVYIYAPLPGAGEPKVVNIEKVPGFDYAKA